MNQPTRRTFLAYTGAGVAVAGVAAVVPGVASASEGQADRLVPEAAVDPGTTGDGPLVAEVTDLAQGHVTIVLGGTEVSVVDVDLARRIARHSRAGV